MSWRGALRSVQTAVRAAERDARRRQRELEKHRQAIAKSDERARAAYEVEVHRNRIDQLISIHKDSNSSIDWHEIGRAVAPNPPQKTTANEESARLKLDMYRPGMMARLLKRSEREIERLRNEIEQSRDKDEATFKTACNHYDKQHAEWKEQTDFADRILNGDLASYLEAIKELKPFSELSDLGSSVRLEFISAQLVKAEMATHGESIIPRETKSLLKSGKLTTKQIPKSEFYKLYQDHICSCVLRISRELLAILPIETVIVSVLDKLVNSSTGHLEEQPILSVLVTRKSLRSLNLDLVDPSDSMNNFAHQMDFKPTSGFRPVERISTEGLMQN